MNSTPVLFTLTWHWHHACTLTFLQAEDTFVVVYTRKINENELMFKVIILFLCMNLLYFFIMIMILKV
jgi:hypothetical protein